VTAVRIAISYLDLCRTICLHHCPSSRIQSLIQTTSISLPSKILVHLRTIPGFSRLALHLIQLMSPFHDIVLLSSARTPTLARTDSGVERLTPERSITTAGSSSVPFLEMTLPLLDVTSAFSALIWATLPATPG